jgi:hypothetical protein
MTEYPKLKFGPLSVAKAYPGIPWQDLVTEPQKYAPLGSVKSVRNLENNEPFTQMDMQKLFLAKNNTVFLARDLYQISQQNGGRAKFDKFMALVPRLQKEYCRYTNLSQHAMAENEATGQADWELTLQAINNEFLQRCYTMLKYNAYVPTREKIMTGPYDNRVKKKLSELTAQDMPTLDVWRLQDINRSNKNFRYNNTIPIWQRSMNVRHYDRANEGLHAKNADRASLNTPVYGYNMNNVMDTLNNWTSTGWFGM